MSIKIAINGFGRIGRQITRLLTSDAGAGLELRAINSLEPIDQAAHLLRYDSNHGIFPQPVTTEGQNLIIGGHTIPFLNQPDPTRLPWSQLGIDLVIEASGSLTQGKAGLHRQSGATKVLITAAADNPDITLCFGVNHTLYQPDLHHIISGSSCTTNCLAPATKVLNDEFTILSSLATFLHSYTINQPLLDGGGHDLRRMRAAGLNIIPTTTSASEQMPKVIPELTGRFDALAIRVPTPEVHLAYLTAKVGRKVTKTEVVAAFTKAAKELFHGIIAVCDHPLVSIDFKDSQPSSVLDAGSIIVQDDIIQIMIWHDNESSYCKRMIDLVRYISSVTSGTTVAPASS
ncbi:MAG: glyceraldehyde-3-phosphate dehydrogenase [Proteobacteria bacterium]|nr:aldehyde dehydrogenase [Desulfobulbaceae bacterium]MBU4152535.1 glyceraldehyde-3-phosphate dehydrogenase [Pseudomonadota bacterium]